MSFSFIRSLVGELQNISGLRGEMQDPLGNYDYGLLQKGPTKIIGDDGNYEPGWFESFVGEQNFQEAACPGRRFQKWFHVHFETPDYFIVANIADLNLGGNVALLVHDKSSGETKKSSKTYYLGLNRIQTDKQNMHFRDPVTHSEIRLNAAGEVFFQISTPDMTLRGEAEECMGKPFTQSTLYSEGMGTLQWWGNLKLRRGELTMEAETLSLPPGCLGAYDRTVGHRPQKQNWNWLSVVGDALDEQSGQLVSFSLQVSKERELAQPRIDSKKYNLWVDGEHRKFSDLSLEYTSNPKTKKSGDWVILAVGEDESLALRFAPRTHRREEKRLPLVLDVDFNQYYGTVSGFFTRRGRRFRVDSTFAVAEESRMVFKI